MLLLFWGVILPGLAKWEPLSAKIAIWQAAGINPAAMFYSEVFSPGDAINVPAFGSAAEPGMGLAQECAACAISR
jgi:hypothetical protein